MRGELPLSALSPRPLQYNLMARLCEHRTGLGVPPLSVPRNYVFISEKMEHHKDEKCPPFLGTERIAHTPDFTTLFHRIFHPKVGKRVTRERVTPSSFLKQEEVKFG